MTQDIFLKRICQRLSVYKWRKKNPEVYRILNKKHQQTWRDRNPELNRQRAKYGKRALKMYKDIIKLAGVKS